MMTDAKDDDATAADPGLGIPSWILLLVFSVVPVVFATGFSQFGVLKDAVLVGGVSSALAVWGGVGLARGDVSFAAGRVLILGVLAALYVAGSVFWSPGILYGSVAASSIVALLGIVVLIAAPLGRPIRFIEFATAVSAGMGLAAVTGLLDLAGLGVFTFIWDPPGFTGTFDAMEFAVAFYAVSLPIAVAGTHYSSGGHRIGFAVASVLGAVHFGLVANWTYLGLFAAACLIVALLIVAFEGVETLLVLSPIGVMVGVVVLINLAAGAFLAGPSEPTDATSLPLLDRERGVQEEALEDKDFRNPVFSIDRMEAVRSMETRGYLARVAFEYIQGRPVFGHGAGAWWRLQTKYPNEDHPAVRQQFLHYPAFRSPHDIYSKVLVEYGPLGFALLALWLIGCLTIGFRALGRSAEVPDLIVEQWGLWAAMVGGLLFGAMTPLIELAPAAAVWFGSIALLTRRSAEVNAYEGASERWTLGGDSDQTFLRTGIGAVAVALAVGMVAVTVLNTVSRLYRGWGDHLMLRTYYERAITQYETADEWMPIHGDTVYNISLAESRLGILGETAAADGEGGGASGSDERARPKGTESEAEGDASAPAADRSGGADAGGPDASKNGARSNNRPKGEQKGRKQKGRKQKGKGAENVPLSPTAKILESPGHERLKRAAEMRPHDTRVLRLAADFYVRVGFSQKSLDFARRAVAAYPNSVQARKTLATALEAVGKLEQAAKELLAGLERDPPQRYRYRLHFQLARLYYSGLEEFANAKEHYQSAREHAPNRSAERRAKKKVEEVKKRIEHQRKIREGELPEGSTPPGPGGEDMPPGKMPGPGGGPGPDPGPMPKNGPAPK